MTPKEQEQEVSTWDTETGLPNDIDAWVAAAKFGTVDKYSDAVQVTSPGSGGATMCILDLVDEAGEPVGQQGYSVGSGWIPSDDGMEITHPKRRNVVGTSVYGQLMNRVRKVLKVPMEKRGLPTEAKSWLGLGFHWMMEEHETVGGAPKPSLMPVEVLAIMKEGVALKQAPVIVVAGELELELKELAQSNTVKDFQKAALKKAEVTSSDELMANVLDEGPSGFWATHQ